ncbi:MAG TPA: hypothetical protein VMB51_05170 [Solirubrobacteraceae bacterium]|nr:hypothetical protein [Solirubrobacteraceae bacterium]
MRRICIVLAALAATLVSAGCSAPHPHSPARAPSRPAGTLTFGHCVTRNPPSMGECVPKPQAVGAAPRASSGARCADWSVWQGYYPSTEGLHCVIIQGAYGLSEEPSVRSQIGDARAHGIPYGVYDFAEPGVNGAAEFRYLHELVPASPLGYATDNEVSGTFWRACEFVAEARNYHEPIILVFSYPGGYAAGGGGYCPGAKLWPSEWGIASPYPFGGFPASSIVIWQFCGGCGNNGADLDQDRGLIALGHPPKPKPPPTPAQRRAKEQRELRADLHLRTILRALEARHNCRNPPYHHPLPDTRAYKHACWGVWVPQGRAIDRQIVTLERELR